MAVERSELELVWPPDLFAAEARALLASGAHGDATLGLLLEEAFYDGRARALFRQLDAGSFPDPWTQHAPNPFAPPTPAEQLVVGLARDASSLRRYQPRRYYSARQRPQAPLVLDLAATKAEVVDVLVDLNRRGYFAEAFGSYCVDDDSDPDAEGQRRLAELLGTEVRLWPPMERSAAQRGQLRHGGLEHVWSREEFLDLLEALHDLVARPRQRTWHEHGQEWDYGDFARRPGRALYRWRMNAILDRSDLGLRLAETGEDTGRLVHAAGDDRDQLLQRTLAIPPTGHRDALTHAVALFRGRDADREAKRSAIVTLAGLLEDRRDRLKAELDGKDEGALFQIANQFDLRHRNPRQRGDYDEAFLEWIFWWYLATIELVDRLLGRQGPDVGPA